MSELLKQMACPGVTSQVLPASEIAGLMNQMIDAVNKKTLADLLEEGTKAAVPVKAKIQELRYAIATRRTQRALQEEIDAKLEAEYLRGIAYFETTVNIFPLYKMAGFTVPTDVLKINPQADVIPKDWNPPVAPAAAAASTTA